MKPQILTREWPALLPYLMSHQFPWQSGNFSYTRAEIQSSHTLAHRYCINKHNEAWPAGRWNAPMNDLNEYFWCCLYSINTKPLLCGMQLSSELSSVIQCILCCWLLRIIIMREIDRDRKIKRGRMKAVPPRGLSLFFFLLYWSKIFGPSEPTLLPVSVQTWQHTNSSGARQGHPQSAGIRKSKIHSSRCISEWNCNNTLFWFTAPVIFSPLFSFWCLHDARRLQRGK